MSSSSRTRHHRETSEFRSAAQTFSRNVRALREGRHWTIEAAAERFGVEPAYARSLETGRTNPSLAVIVSVALAFEMRPHELLAGEHPSRRGGA